MPEEPKSRIKWEGDSLEVISGWPTSVKEQIGGDLDRLERYETPLDFKPMGDGVSELRDEDKDKWYRLLYWLNRGWIYVLHCFIKKTNQTPKRDIETALKRMAAVKKRDDERYDEDEDAKIKRVR